MGSIAVFLTERSLCDALEARFKNNVLVHLANLKMEVTPMTNETHNEPLIGLGLESLIALIFAAGMFSLALLSPVLHLWLPF